MQSEPDGELSLFARSDNDGGRVVPSGLLLAMGSTRRLGFLTGGRFSRAGIASRAIEASDVALFERETDLMSQDAKTFDGQCYCGAVKIVVTGDPVGTGYCHCASCRSWSAGPVNAFTLWKPEAVKVTQGEDQIGEYHKNERSYRQWCKVCGGHLLTRHPQWDLVDVYAATIPSLPFTPGVHVNYESMVLPMKDGLPKLKDFPEELGGSGETLAE
jgi:hypothetical protein